MCMDALFSPLVYHDHLRLAKPRLEISRKQYANFQLLDSLLKTSTPITLDDARKLWAAIMKSIKIKQTELAKVSPTSYSDYWLLRQG